jgi:hypothetical protein
MYGTVAKFRVKPGQESKLMQEMGSYDGLNIDGYVGTTVYRLDSGNDEYLMAVVFRDKESYMKNADSPDQNKRYATFRALLQADPQWQDGEIIYSGK